MWQIISSFFKVFCDSTELDMTVEIDTEKYQIEIDFESLEHGLNINSRLFSMRRGGSYSIFFFEVFLISHSIAQEGFRLKKWCTSMFLLY